MNLTKEQQAIISYIEQPSVEDRVVLVSSVAGSGKTTLLKSIAKVVPHTHGIYLCYNKSVAVESQREFPKSVSCSTVHSLAYQSVVAPFKYKIGTFNFKSINEPIRYEQKCQLVDLIREFCLSQYTSFNEFAASNHLTQLMLQLGNKYLSLMQDRKIECTHDFYLKYFHILLAHGDIAFDPFDFVMIDEAGDLNQVTLEIFKLLPSKLKVAVGDPYQNIYAFNYTVNCFELLRDSSKLFHMSTSFRVNSTIAERIQSFCRSTLDPFMVFVGVPTDNTISTRAFLTRTNAGLVRKMIELNTQRTPYGLVRKASEIFKLPIMLASLKYQGFITDPAYKHIQTLYDDWYETPHLQHDFKTPLSYIASEYKDDVQLSAAINLLIKHGTKAIFDTYKEASKHEQFNHNLTLATAHSVKGLEFDEVVIDTNLNEMVNLAVLKVQEGSLTTSDQPYLDVMNLYYVACSRAKKSLINATALTQPNLV